MGTIVSSVTFITRNTVIDVSHLNLNLNLNLNLKPNIVAILWPLIVKEEDGLTPTQWSWNPNKNL